MFSSGCQIVASVRQRICLLGFAILAMTGVMLIIPCTVHAPMTLHELEGHLPTLLKDRMLLANAEHIHEPDIGLEGTSKEGGDHKGGAHAEDGGNEDGGHESGVHRHGDHGHPMHFSQLDISLSNVIIISVFCHLALIYFLQNKDRYVVHITWKILAQVITIFVSVSIFVAIVGLVHAATEEGGLPDSLLIYFLLAVIVFCGCQVFMFRFCNTSKIRTKKINEIKACGGITAHVMGFALLHFGSQVQQWLHAKGGIYNWWMILVPVLFYFTSFFNIWVSHAVLTSATQYDGTVDYLEEHLLQENFHAVIEANALKVSFLTMQILRYIVRGSLPDVYGNTMSDEGHPLWQSIMIFVLGVIVPQGLSFIITWMCSSQASTNGHVSPYHFLAWFKQTFVDLLERSLGLLSVWAVVIWLQWASYNLIKQENIHSEMEGLIATALFATLCMFILMKPVLTMVRHGGIAEKFVIAQFEAFGMVIGFSWESCFHHALTVSAHQLSRNWFGKSSQIFVALAFILITVSITFLALPAMIRHVVPMLNETEEKEKDAEEEDEEAKPQTC